MTIDGEEETELVLTADDIANDDYGNDVEQEEAEEQAADEGEEEISIAIDGYDEEPEEEKPLTKNLREQLRQAQRELHQYRTTAAPQPIEVGEEPTLESCDWLEDKFTSEWKAWNGRKQDAERQQAEQGKLQAAQQQKMDAAVGTYRQRAAALGVKDYEEVERNVASSLPVVLQNAIPLYFGDKGPLTVLALGRHPKLMAEITAMDDPIAQLLRMKEISMGVKTVTRKAPAPERGSIPQGSAAISSNPGKELERLEKEAARTGDRTKIVAYKAAQRK